MALALHVPDGLVELRVFYPYGIRFRKGDGFSERKRK